MPLNNTKTMDSYESCCCMTFSSFIEFFLKAKIEQHYFKTESEERNFFEIMISAFISFFLAFGVVNVDLHIVFFLLFHATLLALDVLVDVSYWCKYLCKFVKNMNSSIFLSSVSVTHDIN